MVAAATSWETAPTSSADVYIPTARELEVMNTPDHLYHLNTWEDLKRIVAQNSLDDLKRRPSDLKRYLQWGHETRLKYGSIQKYILQERLKWIDELTPKGSVPFVEDGK